MSVRNAFGSAKARVLLHVIGLLIVHTSLCVSGEPKPALSLEDYLKQLGYGGLDFENSDHRAPRLDATLNNGRKPRLLVDTGWAISALTPSYARGLKTLREMGGQLQDPVLGTVTNEDMVLIEKLILGGETQFSNQPARVRDIKADYIALTFDGVLGLDFLLRNFCLIDCWKHRLYVRAEKLSPQYGDALDQSLRMAGFSEVLLERKGLLSVSARINEHPTQLLIDTGAAVNLLDNAQVKELGLSLTHYSRPATGTYIEEEASARIVFTGKVGLQHVKVTKLDSLELGERRWKNVYFGVADLKAMGAAGPGTKLEEIKGFIAQDFLAGRGALIDVSRRKLWLRAPKPAAQSH